MSKFTKGKWKVKYSHMMQGIFDEDNDPVELNEANARLIAAAPDMYELLNNIAWYIEATQKLQKNYLADEFSDYATRAKELLARIDGEE